MKEYHNYAAQVFQQEAIKFPLLTKEEEKELLWDYYHTGNQKSVKTIIERNLRFVIKIAYEKVRENVNVLDLIQEGTMGLMQAIKKYDPYLGFKFSTYAIWWIKASISKYLMDNFKIVKIGGAQAQREVYWGNVDKAIAKANAKGKEFKYSSLSKKYGKPSRDIEDLNKSMRSKDLSFESLVAVVSDGVPGEDTLFFNSSLVSAISDNKWRPDDIIEQKEYIEKLNALLNRILKGFKERDRDVFLAKVHGGDDVSFTSLGKKYGVSRQRLQQIEKRVRESVAKKVFNAFQDSL